jgi:two-component system, LytTR family, response regulator
MNTMNAVVIDDNPAAIADLSNLLEAIPQVELCGCAANVCDGLKMVHDTRPDLIFLDVDMPDKNGFDLIELLKRNREHIPYIVFVTGYDHYVLQALKAGAVDYILKPVDPDELQKAINKVQLLLEDRSHLQKIDNILDYISRNKQIFVPSNMGYRSVATNEIMYIWRNATSDRIEVVLGETDKVVLPQTYSIAQLIELLPQVDFFQIRRELLVNLRYVVNIETFSKECLLRKGTLEVSLSMSRRNLKEFKERMVV